MVSIFFISLNRSLRTVHRIAEITYTLDVKLTRKQLTAYYRRTLLIHLNIRTAKYHLAPY